ncbi:MAG: DNA translocase FtsK [Chloroflexota bacterium]|nr:DNA translocase FtsK [Chloroflexota bacterium]
MGWRRLVPDFILNLNLDQWLDILGYVLLAIAALTILSFLSANNGVLLGKWLGWLRGRFGWGAYPLPLFVGAVGLWLVLREFGDRLPSVTPLQLTGIAAGYLALLVTLHFAAALTLFEGDLGSALSAVADRGLGGGHLGEALARSLLVGLGSGGAIVALLTWWLIVVALTFGVTVQDSARALQRLWGQRRASRARPLPTPKTTSAAAKRAPRKPAPRKKPIPINSGAPVPAASPSRPAGPSLLTGSDQIWQRPTLDEILEPGDGQDFSADILRRQARMVEETLESLGAPVAVREINRGPVVTQFGIEPLVVTNGNGQETKVKVSRISALADDLALALEARTLRVEAPIPGKGLVGIEVPNPEISLVALRDVMESERYAELDSPLRLCLGQDVSGHPSIADLTAMPHLLIAGATGSGKSVCINAVIAALLLQHTPASLRFLMVDPKRVELTGYDGIPHLLSKVVVEMERVTNALQWVLGEMDGRYRRFSEARAIHIRDYNENVAPRLGEKPLPYIVVVVDELADLMMMAPQETERSLCRIAQMARATGIHLIIATQRPSVDVVTGLIKANFPARIAFNVASSVDSRVILDMPGAEQLLGRGDMLFLPPDAPTPLRLQGAFVSDEELRRLVQYWKGQGRPGVVPVEKSVQRPLWDKASPWEAGQKEPKIEYEDELLPEVVDLVLRENRASISLMQRKLRIGYTRAARIMDILERNGAVGPQPGGSKAREVFPGAASALLHPQGEE